MNRLPCAKRGLLAFSEIFMRRSSVSAPRLRKTGGGFSWPRTGSISKDKGTSMGGCRGEESKSSSQSLQTALSWQNPSMDDEAPP